MILSHRHRFIFFKTHKTAGTSLEIALSKFCGPDDVITRIQPADERLRRAAGFRGPQHFVHRPLRDYGLKEVRSVLKRGRPPSLFDNHTKATRLRALVEPSVWNTYFKFTIVRSPWDVALSRYFHSVRKHWRPPAFDCWLASRYHLINRNWPIYTEDDVPLMDFYIAYEDLENDLCSVSARIGTPENIFEVFKTLGAKGGFRAAARRVPSGAAWTAATIDLVAREAAAEIRFFGYAPPVAGADASRPADATGDEGSR